MTQHDDGRHIEWEFFEAHIKRMAHMPGFERVTGQHILEWYAARFASGWFPHELAQAVSWYVYDIQEDFFPGPGKLLRIMQDHRNRLGGRDWESTYVALLEEAKRMAPRIESNREPEPLLPPPNSGPEYWDGE